MSATQPKVGEIEAAAHELRERHVIAPRPASELPVWAQLDAIPAWLERAREACGDPQPAVTKASEWLLDNDYQVERAVLQVREDLPPGFFAQLPSLVGGETEGLPRVFALADGLLHASRLQLSLADALRFVDAYQGPDADADAGALRIAELWAFPTMLRLACLEQLITAFARLIPALEAPFAPMPPAAPAPLDDTECVAHCLANLGIIASIPWKDFFVSTSRVEAILCGDPASVYARMDFETCDLYRRAVEDLARGSASSEVSVAEQAVSRAHDATHDVERERHVGHWLVGDARETLERAIGYRLPLRRAWRRWLGARAAPVYALALVAATLAAVALPSLYLVSSGAGPLIWLLGTTVALLPASVVGFTLVHWTVTRTVPPRVLPKLDFERGIPPECATVVVMPVLVGSTGEVPSLLEQLERHQLANPDPALHFALLSDFADAPAEQMPEDEAVLQELIDGVRHLNARRDAAGRGPFHLLHRPRRYNASEGCWMGWERKRGKLEQLNDLLATGDAGAFTTHEGDPTALHDIRFVVTVDADTLMPPGSVVRLVGTLAHPLNRARFDPRTGRVSSGYTVVQPRVEISPEAGGRSRFARLCAGDTAIDIYTRAVSDVYQDLFGFGIYIGKGAYDVEAFRSSLEGRVPENTLTSHDLFEGVHGRTALATDIVLYEGFPVGYVEFTRRWHRWVRGDWALLPWLGRHVQGSDGTRLDNRLTGLARWMILDNLRRSLIPPSLVALLLAGWLVLPGSPWVWTALALSAPGTYLFSDLVAGVARVGGRRRGAVRTTHRLLVDNAGRWLLAIVFLAQDAAVAVDAIVRTMWRIGVSRRHLLEWTSAAHTAARLGGTHASLAAWRDMWVSPVLALGLGAAVAWIAPNALLAAGPLLLLWAVSPEIAARLARPREAARETLGMDDRAFLRRIARRTWLFFETFVGPDDHWLPPDNFQEEPLGEVAHRTSPTNIGMMFLSSLVACDLGYVGLPELAARLCNGLDTLERLPRHRGHLLNWYDTCSLEPLEPRYVSTVDSGNLAVSLLATRQACEELTVGPVFRAVAWEGLADGLGLLLEALEKVALADDVGIRSRVTAILEQAAEVRHDPDRWYSTLDHLCEHESRELDRLLVQAVGIAGTTTPGTLREVRIWLERVHHHLRSLQRDVESLHPWLPALQAPAAGREELGALVAALLPPALPLDEIPERCDRARKLLGKARGAEREAVAADGEWLERLDRALESGARNARDLRRSLRDVATRAEALAWGMDFRLLYDAEARLFFIGYNVSANRLDVHHYDLLATEARLASFFAVAKGDVPVEHWFHLGRPLAEAHGGVALVSWGGSMFEYLMPSLLLRSHADTLLGSSERTVVEAHRHYAHQLGIPWGISESGFASLGPERHYRYQSFGVPGLGLRRGLSRDLVVAPYAAALALAVRPRVATANLRELERLGIAGTYGFFEAVDFTPERVPEGRRFWSVRSYMAHHQGMLLAAVGNALTEDALVRRFHADRHVRAMDLLLDERVPRELPAQVVRADEHEGPAPHRRAMPALVSWVPPRLSTFPPLHALGNGRLASWITEAGGGGLSWQDQALTRWRPDATLDEHGLWIYVSDEESGDVWSVTRQPTGVVPSEWRAVFHPHLAEFHRRDYGIAIGMEVGVAPGDDVEIRRLSVVNESDQPRSLRLTSYAEVVLAPPLDDERHPAFSKLFVHSEHLPSLDALLFTRRPRGLDEHPPLLLHRVVGDDASLEVVGFDTDRRSLLGRNGTPRRPRGLQRELAGSTGFTLDAAMSLQVRLDLAPQERRQLAFVTMVAGSRESLLDLADRHATLVSLDWALGDAGAEGGRELQRLGLDPARLPALQMLASLVVQPHPALRAAGSLRRPNRLGQPRLWGMGLSGDLPIVLLRATDLGEGDLVRMLILGHQLWRRRGIHADLVVLRTGASGYAEPLRERVFELLHETGGHDLLGRPGGIHLLFADQMVEDERILLQTVAAVILNDDAGTLEHQLGSVAAPARDLPRFEGTGRPDPDPFTPAVPRARELQFDNGIGGFSEDGREYVIHLAPGKATPSPWTNVLANDGFGTVVSESGLGFSWASNSGENRITPWICDPVADTPGEILYLRDEETAAVWTPTPQPAGIADCQIRHGAGYTEWCTQNDGLAQQLRVFVAPEDPVKIVRLRLHNSWPQPRRITATYFAEWLLGALPSLSRPQVVGEYEPDLHALLARNPWTPEFAERVAFLAASIAPHGLTGDRREFLGREGDRRCPAGLARWGLSGKVEPGADACAALQVHLDVPSQGTAEVVFILGQGDDREHVDTLVRRWREPEQVEQGFETLGRVWEARLGAVQLKTPDPAFDLMMNRWLLYQVMASRILARAGFYQAGGAIGFRDQLQDHLALLHADPARTRAHLLRCAAHQFEEGDVLHWWHPPADRGLRTRCSDDLLWLPYGVAHYVEATGDATILDELVPFLRAPPLRPDEDDRYSAFEVSSERRSLFEHCERALERGVTRGAHGLPLIGAGDWNDGMDRVGRRGRGESVWLAWFSIAAIRGYVGLCRSRSETELAARWEGRAVEIEAAIQQTAWDGDWYVRAFDDDGRPWGAAACDECRIDSIAQSWSVLSGVPASEHAHQALASAERELIDADDAVVRLLWPPFEATPRDPGYIKAYPPGIRENGGQYTHAAAWLGWAFAQSGDRDRAARVLALLNPIRLSATAAAAVHYGVEPYVLAADIGGVAPHRGRGGWTWYTGAASWTWRFGVERILGLRLLRGDLEIDPCLPPGWDRFEATLRGPAGALALTVEDPQRVGHGRIEIETDAELRAPGVLAFPTDGSTRAVRVRVMPAGDTMSHP